MAKRTHGRSDAGPRDPGPDSVRRPAVDGPASLEDEIRLRAYHRYLERDGELGDAVSDWLEAESDVLGRRATGVEAAERVSDEEGQPASRASAPRASH